MALAVDPSPEYLARVRSRLASEPTAWWSPLQRGLGAAGAVAIVIALAVAIQRPDPSPTAKPVEPERPPVVAIAQAPVARPAALERAAVRSAIRPAARTAKVSATRDQPLRAIRQPEVIIAADEAAAFRRLISDVRLGRVDLALLPEHPMATVELHPRTEISIAPIALDPLEAVTEEGDRQ